MKKAYHLCVSAGEEIYCRSEEDYEYCFNCLARAMAETDSALLADAVMSTHLHECMRTSSPKEVARIHRYAYSRYFNNKYFRKGRLGEREVFLVELEGLYHLLAAISYVLRNPVHHGITPTPFGYKHCSANVIFAKELGHVSLKVSPSNKSRLLPARVRCPEGYVMNENGLILRESVIDVKDVEHMFSTPRSYLYYMNRISGEEWLKEQQKDGVNMEPVTLGMIECNTHDHTFSEMLRHEHGRSDYRVIRDLELCRIIDDEILPEYGKLSVYQLEKREKELIAEYLYRVLRLPQKQIKRCLAMV